MSFDTLQFFIFFLIVYPLYWLLPHRARIPFLLIGSYYFYIHVKLIYLPIILFSTLLDFWVGKKIEAASSNQRRKHYLLISIFVNLGILSFFKYLDFFFGQASQLVQFFGVDWVWQPLNIAFPIGVSFYTLQTVSYSIDVYNRVMPAAKNIWRFSLFVCFFPQLVAGPLEKARHLLPQFEKVQHFNFSLFYSGIWLIAWGAFKKTVVGDRLNVIIYDVFANELGYYYGPHFLLAGHLSYAKFYCDFSGYTDMALGVAQVMGFRLSQNFRHPTWATNIAEIWRRWHITLFRWLRDYPYSYFVKSHASLSRTQKRMFGIMLIFLLSGLWHGANWTFIIWGFIHGLTIVTYNLSAPIREKIKSLPPFKWTPQPIAFLFGVILTNLVCHFSMFFFMAPNLTEALGYISQVFYNWNFYNFDTFFKSFGVYKAHLFIALIAYSFVELVNLFDQVYSIKNTLGKLPLAVTAIGLWIIVASVVLLHFGQPIAFAYFYF